MTTFIIIISCLLLGLIIGRATKKRNSNSVNTSKPKVVPAPQKPKPEVIPSGTLGIRKYQWDLGVTYDNYTNFNAKVELLEDYGEKVLVKLLSVHNVTGREYDDVITEFGGIGCELVMGKSYIRWVRDEEPELELDLVDVNKLLDKGKVTIYGKEIKLSNDFKLNELMDLIINKI
jgi:hypothetical protein